MLLEHQGVRKGSFFKMLTGSISPGPRDYININILFYFILFFISHVTLLICVQTSTKHSVLTSTTTTTITTNMATTVQQQHHRHHHSSTTMTTTTTRVGAESNMRKVPRRRVSRCLGTRWVILFFLPVFSVLIDMYRYLWRIWRHGDACNDDDNWPKRRETRRLGLHVSFFFALVVFSVYLTMEIGTKDALKVRWGPVGGRRQRQQAQTTRLASFGP